MRIGVVPVLNASGGGHYQYSLSVLQALRTFYRGEGYHITVFIDGFIDSNLLESDWAAPPLKPPSIRRTAKNFVRKVIGEERLSSLWQKYRDTRTPPEINKIQQQPEMGRWFREQGIDLMLYPSANPLSFECGIPYVMAIHDLQHLLQPEFPENSERSEMQWREYVFRNGAKYALSLLADSEVGKEDILHFYRPHGVSEDSVKVLPFLPATYLSREIDQDEKRYIAQRYRLPARYLFYPAQFWPHKNHLRIIRALGFLRKERSLEIPIVLCGSRSGELRSKTFEEVLSVAEEFGIGKNVICTGFLPDEEMAAFYAGATALIMPTFHGPTNIPVLEAWAFGCPVLTSDLRGIREQAGEAAVLVDPRSIESIAEGIFRLWTDEQHRKDLAARGRERLALYTPQDFAQRLKEILSDARTRLKMNSKVTA